MPWRPLPRIAFAICTYPFQPSSPADLPLQIGDELYIIEQGGKDGAWYRGYLVAPPSLLAGLTSRKGHALEARVFSGIFPKVCVEVRELLGEVVKYGRDDQYVGESALKLNGAARLSGAWPVPPRKNSAATTSMGEQDATDTRPVTTIPAGQKPPAPVPMLKIGDETLTSKEEPLVDEIGSCLKEWHSSNLHELLLSRQYGLLDEMSALVDRLDSSRRQLLHKTLTKHELAELRDATIWDLVHGNKTLNGEVIVRSADHKGRILTADDSSIVVSELQAKMSLFDERPEPAPEFRSLHHLLVNVKSVAAASDKPSTYVLSIYLKPRGEPITMLSENFTIDGAVPPPVSSSTIDERLRTLFVNLNNTTPAGGFNEESKLFLVVKTLSTEPYRLASHTSQKPFGSESGFNASLGNLNATLRSGYFMAGRKSLKSQGKDGAAAAAAADANSRRPATASSQAKSFRSDVNKTDPTTPAGGNKGGTAKRTAALGVLEITDMIRREREATHKIALWSSMPHAGIPSERDESWNDVIKELMPLAAGGSYTISAWNTPVEVQIQSFRNDDSDALVRQMPTLLHNVQPTPRIGFAGAPTSPRSDIYLTLRELILPPNAFLSHPRLGSVPMSPEIGTANLQLTLEVRDSSGSRISHCVHPSANAIGHTAWRTTAVEAGESWNQTIRLAIDPKDVPGAHVVMSIADGANFPFALCWMPLWTDEAFIRDSEHSLTMYRYDEHTSNMYNGKGAYLKLPWSVKTKDEIVTGPVASVRLQTFLCSTKYSQDPTLLGLLRWHDLSDESDLVPLLKKFAFVPEIEIVKLLPDVFDSLFNILVVHAGTDEVEDAVFSAVVFVSSIIHDRRFHLDPLIDHYIKNQFDFPFAFPCLIRSFVRLLSNPTDPEVSRQLRATCKVAGHILKFMVNARQQQIIKEAGIGISSHSQTFARDLQSIFDAVESLMRMQSSVLIGTKTLIVQNFPTWLPELSEVMTPVELANIAAGFVDSCSRAEGRLVLFKLVLILNLSSTRILTTSEVQQAWHKRTLKWMDPYWGMTYVPSPQWREQIRLCCSIIATQVQNFPLRGTQWVPKLIESYAAIKAIPKRPSNSFSLLFPRTVPFPSKSIQSTATFDEALIEIAALLSIANNDLMYYGSLQSGISDLLSNALKLCKSILNCEAFPSTWLSLYVFHHKSILQFLETLSDTLLKEYLPPPDDANDFSTEIWGDFFAILIKLCSSNALALEAFPEQKRRAVWKIAGDVRELGADLLQRMWQAIGWELSREDQEKYSLEKMGGYQVQYVPALVGPIVELCLSVHEGLRSVAIEILRTMIASEWALSQDFSVIQAEIISSLDGLFKTRTLKESVPNKIFIADLLEPFEQNTKEKDPQLSAAVRGLVDVLDQLLDLLIAVHSAPTSGEASQTMDTLRLMIFLRDMQKTEIYVDYVHKLAQVQADANNPIEAGLALKMHADFLAWDFSAPLEASATPRFPAQTKFERKEQIYFEMIKYFEEGSAWQLALNAYTELAHEYEYSAYDLSKLARAHRAIASIQDKISKGDRQQPKFFRVVFRGLGFAPSLRGRQFIIQGAPSDRLPTFTDKMLSRYSSAQIAGGDDVDELEGQYLSIYPVAPQRNFYHPINRRAKVLQPVREHYTLANPKHFTTTSRRQASHGGGGGGGGGGVKDQAVEKILYTTADSFPTILRQSEIISTETVVMSPVQIGLERTNRKTQELLALESDAVAEPGRRRDADMAELLTVLVSPKSNGNVAEYWDLVMHPPPASKPGLGALENESLLYEALKIALFDHIIIIRRCLTSSYSRPADQATRNQLIKDFEHTFAPVIARAQILTPPSQSEVAQNTSQWQQVSLPEPLSTLKAPLPQPISKESTSPKNLTPDTPSTHTQHLSPTAAQSQKTPRLNSLRSLGSGFKNPNTRNYWHASSRSSMSDQQPHASSSSAAAAGAAVAPAPVVGYTNGATMTTSSSTTPTAAATAVATDDDNNNNSENNATASNDDHHQAAGSDSKLLSKQNSSQSLKSGLQARVGNATRRLSSINLGKRGIKASLKSPTIASVEE